MFPKLLIALVAAASLTSALHIDLAARATSTTTTTSTSTSTSTSTPTSSSNSSSSSTSSSSSSASSSSSTSTSASTSSTSTSAMTTSTSTITTFGSSSSGSSTSTTSASTTSSSPPPTETGRALHPNGNTSKCLDVRGNIRANGTPVQIYDCNGTGAQSWVFNGPGETTVRLAGTTFCLDAGVGPHNNVSLKIWACYSKLPQQNWYYTADRRMAVTGQGQCMDLRDGNLYNGGIVQTYKCTDFNTNQVWTD